MSAFPLFIYFANFVLEGLFSLVFSSTLAYIIFYKIFTKIIRDLMILLDRFWFVSSPWSIIVVRYLYFLHWKY